MAQGILSKTRSTLGKVFFVAMMSLLVGSFVIWGVSDQTFNFSFSNAAATVGDREISIHELQEEFRNELNRQQVQAGQPISSEAAKARGLHLLILERMIQSELIQAEADDLGLRVSNEALRSEIQSTEAFKGPDGQFDRLRYEAAVRNLGEPLPVFEANLRQDIKRLQLMGSLGNPYGPPGLLAETIYKFRNEKRIAEYLFIPSATIAGLQEPSEEALKKFYEDNKEALFKAPEYRNATVLVVRAQDIAKTLAVSEADVKKAYEARIDQYTKPETRDITQLIVSGEEKAREAGKLAEAGKPLEEVAEKLNIEGGAVTLDDVTRSDMVVPELGERAFTASVGAAAGPVKSDLGWHVIRVKSVSPQNITPLSEVSDDIKTRLATERAIDQMFTLTNRIEDTLAGGASLAAAAEAVALKPLVVEAVDNRGQTPGGEDLKLLKEQPKILATIFDTEQGRESGVQELGADAFYIVQVNEVIPSAVEPFDQVRSEVEKAWRLNQRNEAAEKQAEEAKKAVEDGKTLDAVASELGLAVQRTQAFTRLEGPEDAGFHPRTVQQLFQLKEGGVMTGTKLVENDADAGHFIIKMKDVIPADPKENKQVLDEIRQQMGRAIETDMAEQYLRALANRHGVERNTELIDQSIQ